MPLFSRSRPTREDAAPAPGTAPAPAPTGDPAADGAAAGRAVSPARAPKLPDGWTYRLTSAVMGDARVDVVDHKGRSVATARFVGHADSPDFVVAPACAQAHATWQASGGVVHVMQSFTASTSPEGAGWRVWCNQALGVTFVVDDLEEAPSRMAQALAEAKGLEPDEVSVTMVATR